MKVLLVAPASDFTSQVKRAFQEELHEVVHIDDRLVARYPVVWWVIRHTPPLRRLRNAVVSRRILRQAKRQRPDLVLFLKGMTVKPPTLRKLRDMGLKTANWFPENGLREPYKSWLDTYIGLFDMFFAFDSAVLGRRTEFPGTSIIYLPFGVRPDAYAVSELTDEDHARFDADICFVGAHYPEREKVLAELTQWNVKIFGWRGWEKSSLAHLYGGPLNAHESAKAYRCAKIVLNMNLQPPVNGVNAKTFEICAAGGFQLTDFRADLSKLFQEDREVVVFRDAAELKAKIATYLNDEQARKQIAQAGYERVMREHTMSERVKTIVAHLA